MPIVEPPEPDDPSSWDMQYGKTRAIRGWRIARMNEAVDVRRPRSAASRMPVHYRTVSQRPYTGAIPTRDEVPDDVAAALFQMTHYSRPGHAPYRVSLGTEPRCECEDFVKAQAARANEILQLPADLGELVAEVRWCKHIWATAMWLSNETARNTWFPRGQRVQLIGEEIMRGTVISLRDWRVLVEWDDPVPAHHNKCEYCPMNLLRRFNQNNMVLDRRMPMMRRLERLDELQ